MELYEIMYFMVEYFTLVSRLPGKSPIFGTLGLSVQIPVVPNRQLTQVFKSLIPTSHTVKKDFLHPVATELLYASSEESDHYRIPVSLHSRIVLC